MNAFGIGLAGNIGGPVKPAFKAHSAVVTQTSPLRVRIVGSTTDCPAQSFPGYLPAVGDQIAYIQLNNGILALGVPPSVPSSGGSVITGTGDPTSVSIAYTLPGPGDSDASGAHAVAIGPFTQALGNGSVVAGYGSTASVLSDIAIGNGAFTDSGTSGSNIAIGNSAVTYASTGIAIGYAAQIDAGAHDALAIGENPRAGGLYATALGGVNAHATAEASTALGSYTTASGIGSVAVGTDSTDTGAQAPNMDDFVLGTTIHKVSIPGLFGVHGAAPVAQSANGSTVADAIACLIAHGLMAA